MGVVYKITNIVNGKIYVGKTMIGLKQRWAQHRSKARTGATSYLYRAIRKYDEKSFVIEVIASASTETELTALEVAWIAQLQSTNAKHGYNCTTGGDGQQHTESSRSRRVGWHHTPEALAKIRAAHIGRKHTPEHREKWRRANIGRKQSPEEIKRRAATNRKVWQNAPEKREKQRLRSLGRRFKWRHPMTEEQRLVNEKNSRAFWGSDVAAKAKHNLSIRMKAMDHSKSLRKAWDTRRSDPVKLEEYKRKVGAASKERRSTLAAIEHYKRVWTEEKRKAFGDSIRKRTISDETRKRQSIAAHNREATKRLRREVTWEKAVVA